MELGWKIIVGTLIGIFGASFGSVGGVGGGGIFVPMLILIIGFDAKSAAAISKCKNLSLDIYKAYTYLFRKFCILNGSFKLFM
jgi:uncharacterized membrane protein YfcA